MPLQTIPRMKPDEIAAQVGVRMLQDAFSRGMTLSQHMESLDPSDKYDEKSEDRKLDAFERAVRSSGLIVQPVHSLGIRASTWEEATETTERRALMHEMACRVWRQVAHQPATMTPQTRAVLLSSDGPAGSWLQPFADDPMIHAKRLQPPIPLSEIVARTLPIDGDAYRGLYITDAYGMDSYRYKRVSEGASIPTTTLVTGEHTIRLLKFARALRYTYEQLRRQRIDRIMFLVARMALQAEVDKVAIAMNTLVNGDGNANTAAVVTNLTTLDTSATAGTLTLKAWLTFKSRFNLGYTLTTLLGQEASIIQTLLLPVNTVNGIPLALLPAGNVGDLTPIAPRLAGGVRYGISSDAPSLELIGFDNSMALERVTEIGGTISEVERFIHNQTQLLTMSETEGYAVLDPFASQVLNVNG